MRPGDRLFSIIILTTDQMLSHGNSIAQRIGWCGQKKWFCLLVFSVALIIEFYHNRLCLYYFVECLRVMANVYNNIDFYQVIIL